MYGGTCIDGLRNYTCQCPYMYNGTNCENDLISMYGCGVEPCLNGGTCETVTGIAQTNYRCQCVAGNTYFLAHLYEIRAIAVTTALGSALASALLKMLKVLVKVFKSLYLLNLWMDLVDTLV